MAIYYVDPYLNASVNGIQGTNQSSARTGTWADPFNCFDVMVTASNNITSTVNGVPIVSGDEIRIKGLPSLDSFVFGTIRTTGNGSSHSSRNIPDSADQTVFSSWKSLLSSGGFNNRGVFYVSDTHHSSLYDNIAGTDIPKGLYMNQTNNSGITTQVNVHTSATVFNLSGLFNASRNTNCDLYLKLIHPQYVIKNTSNFTNILSISTTGIKISAGWTAEGVQDGHTIFPLQYTSASVCSVFANVTASSTTYDLGNFHLFAGNLNSDTINTSLTYFRNVLDNTTAKLGTLSVATNGVWSYIYFDRSTTTNVHLKIGAYGVYYNQMVTQNMSSGGSTFTLANYYSGLGVWVNFNGTSAGLTHIYGNMWITSPYSGSSLIYSGNSTTSSVLRFLPESYLYGLSNMPLLISNFGSIDIRSTGNVYNYASPQFTAAFPNSLTTLFGLGPVVKAYDYPQSGQNTEVKCKLNPSSWFDQSIPVDMLFNANTITTYSYGQLNTNMGYLDTEGLDYRYNNPTLSIASNIYTSANSWSDNNRHFGSNSYDAKPIGTFTIDSTTLPFIHTPLLCYNDENGDLVVQCNANAQQNTLFSKKVSLGYIDVTGKTLVNISVEIEKNSGFSVTAPILVLIFRNSAGTFSTSGYNPTLVGNKYTFSASLSATALSSTPFHLGMSIRVYNSGGYENKYTIKNISTVLT